MEILFWITQILCDLALVMGIIVLIKLFSMLLKDEAFRNLFNKEDNNGRHGETDTDASNNNSGNRVRQVDVCDIGDTSRCK